MKWQNLQYGIWRTNIDNTDKVVFQIVTHTLPLANNLARTEYQLAQFALESHKADRVGNFSSVGDAKARGKQWLAEFSKEN